MGQRVAPALLDRCLARTGVPSQQGSERAAFDHGNMFATLDDAPGRAHSATMCPMTRFTA